MIYTLSFKNCELHDGVCECRNINITLYIPKVKMCEIILMNVSLY